MPEMFCMYCGSPFVAGGHCDKGPSGKHVGIPNGNCVYCGGPVLKGTCLYSPTQKHSPAFVGDIRR